jgi:hypothetical protein
MLVPVGRAWPVFPYKSVLQNVISVIDNVQKTDRLLPKISPDFLLCLFCHTDFPEVFKFVGWVFSWTTISLSIKGHNIVTCMRDYRRGFGLEIGFIDHFNTRLVTTLNYSAVADLHTLQITRGHAKSFPVCNVFPSRFLVTASNSEDSSTAPTKSSLHRFPYNSLSTDSVTTN